MIKAIRQAATDNVATLLGNLAKGERVEVISIDGEMITTLTSRVNISFGNKIALNEIAQGQDLHKAGFPIGYAINDIATGQLVHVQNVRSKRLNIPDKIIEIIIKEMEIEQ